MIAVSEVRKLQGRSSVRFSLFLDDYSEVEIGYLTLEVFDTLGSIELLYVKPEFRDKGNASKLMDRVVQYLDEHRLTSKLLPVQYCRTNHFDKKISKFYEKYGFVFCNDLFYMFREIR